MGEKNILITGPPGCGKSTLIEKVVRRIHLPVTGFFTREIREKHRRVGFYVVTFDGKEGVLAREKIKGPLKVGKYGVRMEDLDRIAVPAMNPSRPDQIVIIDEIGKMECLSPLFRETLIRTLEEPNRVIASIALRGTPFIEEIKKRKDVSLILISEKNRDTLPDELAAHVES